MIHSFAKINIMTEFTSTCSGCDQFVSTDFIVEPTVYSSYQEHHKEKYRQVTSTSKQRNQDTQGMDLTTNKGWRQTLLLPICIYAGAESLNIVFFAHQQ